ncbi:MAG: hypothetical protein KDJ27_02220 [Gammaproteobacteria bacterium]|nr:hypothetical protein [Gammaproteobacteria bacterium]
MRYILCAAASLAAGCASYPPMPPPSQRTPTLLVPASLAGVHDRRAAFRQLFCSADSADNRAALAEDAADCSRWLVRVGSETDESAPTSTHTPAALRIVIVLGFGWDCLQGLFDAQQLPARHLQRQGYDVTELQVDGLAGSAHNARLIRDALAADGRADPRPLLLIGYSKGVVDILEALVEDAGLSARVAAVVSVAGAIGGSVLADETSADEVAMLRALPGGHCDAQDSGALESLRPHIRQRWLAHHPLPTAPRYYSVVTFPRPDNVSALLSSGHRRLSQVDAHNDGALLPQDQVIPGSHLLAYVDADHWSVALPVDGTAPVLAAFMGGREDFPLDRLWATLVRFVEQDLAHARRAVVGEGSVCALTGRVGQRQGAADVGAWRHCACWCCW